MPEGTSPEHETHAKDGLPIIAFSTQQELEEWLEANHDTAPGVWLKLAKKASGIPTIDWKTLVDSALCFGWIDGQANKYDDTWSLQRLTPRRKRSQWSQINTENVARLSAEGRIRPAGQRVIDEAKADGRWDAAYPSVANRKAPPDLQNFLDDNPEAAAFWATLNSTNQFAVIYRLHSAKKPETRAKRFAEFTTKLSAGEKILP